MRNKPTAWLGTSPAIQDIIKKEISNCVKRIQAGPDTDRWVPDRVEECVSNILF